jgi:hypothetical protein
LKTYIGMRVNGQHSTSRVGVKPDDGPEYPLELRNFHESLVPISPDGHAWGYGGAGPTQMALDILWDVSGKEPSRLLVQRFKEKFIATCVEDIFILTEETIQKFIEESVFRNDEARA